MKYTRLITLLLACYAISGCSWFAHKAKRIEAPDFTPIHQAADRAEKSTESAAKAAAKAGEHLVKAKARHGEAITSHRAEGDHIVDANRKVEGLKPRVTVELRPEVDALAGDLISLRAQHSTTTAALNDTGMEIGESAVAADEALNAARSAKAEQESIRTMLSPDIEAKAIANVEALNTLEVKYANCDAERWHLLGQKTFLITIAALSVIAGIALRFYKP